MHNITFDMSRLHQHGAAFFDYLRLRKQFFVDTLCWDIPHNKDSRWTSTTIRMRSTRSC